MPLLYNFIFSIYSLIYLPFLLLTRRWHKDFIQRFGLFSPGIEEKLKSSRNIWVHAVSVGEVNAIEGFLRELKSNFPQEEIVITVTTKTGYELAQKRLSSYGLVIASPLDLTWVVHKFIRLIQPKIYVAAETEIWPNLFEALHQKNVPIAIINGRISDKSLPRYQRIKFFFKKILSNVDLFCMQSDLDKSRIMQLGADLQKVKVTGNLKFDDLPQTQALENFGFRGESKLWICGSTHPGEEEIILEVYKSILPDHPSWQLVIAPRHVERAGDIIRLVESHGFSAVRFSQKGSQWPLANQVVVVDTIGHLRNLYSLASVVFVGKSLCGSGGQNIIEPAFFGKPIITGPKMENFRDIAACFQRGRGIVQVKNASFLEVALRQLMEDEAARAQLGERARQVIAQNQGALKRTLENITQLL